MDRYEQELDILERISQILGDGLEINEVFQRAMALISEKLEIQRACLLLRDDATDMARIVAAVGLSPQDMQKGQYPLGEGVTGSVLQTGKGRVIPDISKDPQFLNRIGTGTNDPDRPTRFICVPIRNNYTT